MTTAAGDLGLASYDRQFHLPWSCRSQVYHACPLAASTGARRALGAIHGRRAEDGWRLSADQLVTESSLARARRTAGLALGHPT
jgi:hypothetical protein